MAIIYKDPNILFKTPEEKCKWEKWVDYEGGSYNFWHDGVVHIGFEYKTWKSNASPCPILSNDLVACLERIKATLIKGAANFESAYSVKSAKIDFVYKDEVYEVTPYTFGLDNIKELDYNHGALFEKYRNVIKEILQKDLGVEYTRYNGYID